MNLGLSFPKYIRIMPWIFHYLLWILPFSMGQLITAVETITFEFKNDNPRFVEGEGAKMFITYGSNFEVRCPHNVDPKEYYVLYWVQRDWFEGCFIPANVTLSPFLECNSPDDEKGYTMTVQGFHGIPGNLHMVVNQSYYLTTMSTGTRAGLNNTFAGACALRNMKLNITVLPRNHATTKAPPDPSKTDRTQRPSRTTQKPTTTPSRPTTPPTTTASKATTRLKTTHRPHSTDIPDFNSGDIIIDGSNSAVIDTDSAHSLTFSWLLLFSICLSIINLVKVMR